MNGSAGIYYIGTYTGSDSEGIYAFRLNSTGTEALSLGCVAKTSNPSYLYRARTTQTMYVVDESTGASGQEGSVLAYRTDSNTGELHLLDRVGSGGVGPCFLAMDASERHLFVANFHSGSIRVTRLRADGGFSKSFSAIQLHGSSIHPLRQLTSHPHAILATTDERHAVVADLGADALLVFAFDPTSGQLSEHPIRHVRVPAGSGPRHMAVHPHGDFLYVIHEISSVITVHPFGGEEVVGAAIQIVATTPACGDDTLDGADLVIDAHGKRLYASTRRTSSIRPFSIHPTTGQLETIQDVASGGATPQSLTLSRDGRWLMASNLDSNSVCVFACSGRGLVRTLTIPVPSPSCVCPG